MSNRGFNCRDGEVTAAHGHEGEEIAPLTVPRACEAASLPFPIVPLLIGRLDFIWYLEVLSAGP